MTRTLIGIPLRLGRRGAGLALNVTVGIARGGLSWAAELAGAVLDRDRPDVDVDGTEHRHDAPAREPAREEKEPSARRPRPPRSRPAQPSGAGAAPRQPPAPAAPDAETAPPEPAQAPAPPSEARAAQDAGAAAAAAEPAPEAEPAHVSEEPTLVEEFAEPGAEDGAGAQVRIDEPWDGYGSLAAADIVDRLSGADAAVIAAVELYEGMTRRRRTVLNAAEQELRRAQAER